MSSTPDIEALIARCRNGSPSERERAVAELQQLGAREAVPVMLELAAFPDAGVRANVAQALGLLGGEVGPVLVSLSSDSEAVVRMMAIESLGIQRYAAGMATLVDTLRTDEDALVRVHAAEALAEFDDIRASSALVGALEDQDYLVRGYAAYGLGLLKHIETSAPLRRRFESEASLFVKANILSALHRLGDGEAAWTLVGLVAEADDVLAVTILNLAAELASAANADHLAESIAEAARTRPALQVEANDLIPRILKQRVG